MTTSRAELTCVKWLVTDVDDAVDDSDAPLLVSFCDGELSILLLCCFSEPSEAMWCSRDVYGDIMVLAHAR